MVKRVLAVLLTVIALSVVYHGSSRAQIGIGTTVINNSGTPSAGGTCSSLGGDLSGTCSAATTAKINGATLGTVTPTSGNVMIGDSSQWVTRAVSGDATISSTGAVTLAAKHTTREIVFIQGNDAGTALADTDDQATIFPNRLGGGITITEVWCESDAGTPIINIQRDDGTPANVLSSDLTCTTSGATGTIDTGEDNVANTDKLDFVMVTAGGTAKRVTVAIKVTID